MAEPVYYQAPSIEDLRNIFGEELTEIEVQSQSSDVDVFVEELQKALEATKEHSIQFG